MTQTKKEELICAIAETLERFINDNENLEQRKSDEPTEMLTIREATQQIRGLSEHTVRQLIAQGRVPSIRTGAGINGKILVPKAALINYLNGREV